MKQDLNEIFEKRCDIIRNMIFSEIDILRNVIFSKLWYSQKYDIIISKEEN